VRAGEVGWQQHKMSVRLGSGLGSNMHIIAMQMIWLAEGRVSGTSFFYCAQNRTLQEHPRLNSPGQCTDCSI
jgi:hypothetical protein